MTLGRALIVEADGGSRGNPGVAGWGALVRDPETRQILVALAEPLGQASNNVAEYSGLVAGLTEILAVDPGADVEVRMDSKLVVEQMSGRWKIKHEDMRRLATVARDLAARISDAGGSVTYRWIPREKNKDADKLSNEAMDGHSVRRVLASEQDDGAQGAREPQPTGPVGEVPKTVVGEEKTLAGEEKTLAGETGPGSVTSNRPVDLGPGTRLVLVRHGATDNTLRRLDGRGGPNPGLNAEGLHQARAAARGVRAFLGDVPPHLVASTLERARQTAHTIGSAYGIGVETDDRWDEQGLGEWEGLTMAEVYQREPQGPARLLSEPDWAMPGGESRSQLADRVRAATDQLIDAYQGRTVVVATHRGPIAAVLASVLGVPIASAWKLHTSPGSLTAVKVWADGNCVVEFVNDCSHLR